MAIHLSHLANRTLSLDGREQQLVSEGRLKLSLCSGSSSTTTATDVASHFAILPSVMASLEAERLRLEASALAFDTRPDSVDRQPAHELYIVKDGALQPGAARLSALMQPSVDRLTHLANELHPQVCRGQCTACTSLVRRYLPGERRGHHEHMDGHAAVTAIVDLTSAGEDYEGGLFVSDLRVRRFLPLRRGDAVLRRSWRRGPGSSEGSRRSSTARSAA